MVSIKLYKYPRRKESIHIQVGKSMSARNRSKKVKILLTFALEKGEVSGVEKSRKSDYFGVAKSKERRQ